LHQLLQHRIASLMAEGVIHLLEVIQIQNGQRPAAILAMLSAAYLSSCLRNAR
jgi:hypothetical protein